MLHLLALATSAVSPLAWASDHIHLIGWPTLCVIAWKVRGYFSEASSQITKTVTQIDQMATNHFPHMQDSLARQDLYLENIDKNIERLVDRKA